MTASVEIKNTESVNTGASEKVTYIDSLTPMRGLAAIWVMLFHIDVSLFYRDLGGLVPRHQTGIFSQGYLWVDFFFLLSGFVMMHVYGARLHQGNKLTAIKDYLWARFARVYPLHIFTLSLLIICAPLAAYWFPSVVDGSWKTFFAWSALPSHFLFTHAMNQHVYLSWNIVSWSIAAEWWTYVAASVVIWFLWGRSQIVNGLIMALGFGLLVVLVYSLPDKKLDITFNYGFFRCLFEFVIGLGLYSFYQRGRWQWLAKDYVILALLLCVAGVFHFYVNDLAIITVFCCLILAVSYNRARTRAILQRRLFQYLGTISYSIYLMHGVWFMFFWFLLPWVKLTAGWSSAPPLFKLAYVVVFVGLSIGSAGLSYKYVEVPGRSLLNGVFKTRRTRKVITGEYS